MDPPSPASYSAGDGARQVVARDDVFNRHRRLALGGQLHQVDVFSGIRNDGYILINTTKTWNELGLESLAHSEFDYRRLTVPASEYAMKYVGRPLPNAALLGGYAAATRQVALESVVRAIEERFPTKIAEANVNAAREAYTFVREQKLEARTHA